MKDHGYAPSSRSGVTRLGDARPHHPAQLPFVIYAMMANVSVGAVPRRHPARRADGAADDGHGGVLRAQERLGRRHPVLAALRQGADRDRVVGWPLACWHWCTPARLPQLTVAVALVAAVRRRPHFRFQAVLPIMTPVLLIGGMTTGIFTPTEGAIAACVCGRWCWACLVPHALLEDVRQGLPRHGGDHRHGDVHRRRGHRSSAGCSPPPASPRHRRLGAGGHQRSPGCSCCWPTC